jgi:glycosyl hydrolase family 113
MPHPTTSLDLSRIRDAGVDHVSIDVWWDFDLPNATLVHPGTRTLSDRDLGDAIAAAHRAGAKVILTPKLWCVPCLAQGFTWRGRLSPGDVGAFFVSYRSMINHYAELARDHGVDIFFIGSEMSLVQYATDEWRRVAREARARFAGRLAYEVNWDVMHDVAFWDGVDIVGVSAYFPLSDAERPSVQELKTGWRGSRTAAFRGHEWFDRLARLATATGKPLLFGEAGYMSSTYAGRAPYDPNQAYKPDHKVQANAYQALLETFGPQPWWLGVVWWEWSFAYGGERDLTYTPRGKPAEEVLRRFYGARS